VQARAVTIRIRCSSKARSTGLVSSSWTSSAAGASVIDVSSSAGAVGCSTSFFEGMFGKVDAGIIYDWRPAWRAKIKHDQKIVIATDCGCLNIQAAQSLDWDFAASPTWGTLGILKGREPQEILQISTYCSCMEHAIFLSPLFLFFSTMSGEVKGSKS
jgi:hypothetical protein